jgi:hypothetical protein
MLWPALVLARNQNGYYIGQPVWSLDVARITSKPQSFNGKLKSLLRFIAGSPYFAKKPEVRPYLIKSKGPLKRKTVGVDEGEALERRFGQPIKGRFGQYIEDVFESDSNISW